MILCFQFEDLSKILFVSQFEMNWPNIKLITFCAIWHYLDLELMNACPVVLSSHRKQKLSLRILNCCLFIKVAY